MAGSRCFHKKQISGGISESNQFGGQQHASVDYTVAFLSSMLGSMLGLFLARKGSFIRACLKLFDNIKLSAAVIGCSLAWLVLN